MTQEVPRYEIKCVGSLSTQDYLRSWVHTHGAGFRKHYEPRIVNSIYFDTIDWYALVETNNGSLDRTKCRVRWYSSDLDCKTIRVELKRRRGRLGWKCVEELSLKKGISDYTWHALLSEIRTRCSAIFQANFESYDTPTILGRYKREYYISADNRIRVTIDTDIEAYSQLATPSPSITQAAPLSPLVIGEIKFLHTNYEHGQDVLASLPFHPSRCSKYSIGLNALLHS